KNGQLIPGRLGGSDLTLVDYNRAGVPLLEIVSEPEMRTPEEAMAYVMALRDVLRWLGVSDCKMEEGSLRCDANISLRTVGATELGTKTEIKNMNSFKSIGAAIAYEVERQAEILRAGGKIIQETRGWDENRGLTISMRSKEEAHDYRYFPEPDLPLLEIDSAWVERIDASLPELPAARLARYQNDFGLAEKEAAFLTADRFAGDFFEQTVQAGLSAAETVKWLANDVARLSNELERPLSQSRLSPAGLAASVALVGAGKVNQQGAQKVVESLFREGGRPEEWVERLGLAQLSDESALGEIISGVLAAAPEVVREYREGKKKAFNVLVGQTMKQTKGRANPQTVNQLLKEILDAD
ncbi:MAG: Asp-tRNA(Asn)/Glu-tRNA(Gln) amidotransferase subunit GatB, partial [Candidatus Eremiobacteraeota bacterium]|nr:Asp-tRNA(Asn)/Glu-tRNA(Gln) amidotransferase subunit GatB [Candidatus Eremiobacteraeota bacterium]